MNVHQLEIFYHVACYESITKASEALSISQPAVSAHIKNLESYYSTKLFDKSGRGIRLTDLGTELFELISPFFSNTLPRVEALLNDTQHLKIYGNYLMTQFVVPETLQNLQNREVVGRLIIKSMSSHDALESLRSDHCDLALVSSSEMLLLDKTLIVEELFDDTIVYIRNNPEDDSNLTLITSHSKRDIKDLVKDQFPFIQTMTAIEVETTQDVIANLQVNHNVASFISSKFLEYYNDHYYVEPTVVSTKFYSIYRASSPNRRSIEALISLIKNSLYTK